MDAEERIIEVPGFNIALKMWNTGVKKPVLCLHGKMDNAASFDYLAPLLPGLQLVAVDYPGTGFSSHYPRGVLPYWKNDALLLLHVIKALGWEQFDIVAHSLGGMVASFLALARPRQVRKLVFLDILGPTVNFIENRMLYLQSDIETYLGYEQHERSLFANEEEAITTRMKSGNISHQAAEALVRRGTRKTKEGLVWTFDPRLRCLSATLPYEDELRAMLEAIEAPVCLIRAKQGVPYPESTFKGRVQSVKDLRVHEVEGGHHVHMDNPEPVARIVSDFLISPSA